MIRFVGSRGGGEYFGSLILTFLYLTQSEAINDRVALASN